MLLGSGELGKEFTIAAKRAGQYVIACDKYDNAPAMQVADEREVFSMLDGDALTAVVEKHHPDIIVPEIEAIRTERLFDFEKEGIQIVPSARAVNYTMNRRAIRDLAAKELGLRTAKYFYAKTFEEFKNAADEIGFPCVVKPLMSSSGHGQSYVHNDDELKEAYKEAMEEGRGDVKEVIIEEFIDFDSEFTLLTVTQKDGPTLFCPPIGHVQKGGDYRESWQPFQIPEEALKKAATFLLLVDHLTLALVGFEGLIVCLRVKLSPISSVFLVVFRETPLTSVMTLTRQIALKPPSFVFAVITALPVFLAVILPEDETSATS